MIEALILRPDVKAKIERWLRFIEQDSGSGTVEVVISFDMKDRRVIKVCVGGTDSRIVVPAAV